MKKYLSIALLLLTMTAANAQVGIGTTTPKAVLDIPATNAAAPSNLDGILIPRINAFPITNPSVDQNGMMVFLTTDLPSKPKGFYYWDNPTATWIGIGGTTGDADFYEVGTTTPPDAITDNMFHTGNVGIGNNNPLYKLDVDETASGKIYAMRARHSNPVDGGISSGIQSTISGASISSGVVQGVSTVVTPGANTAGTGLRNLMGGTSSLDVSGVVNSISADGSGARTGVSNSISGTGTGITYGMYNSFSNPNASAYLGVRTNMLAAGTGYKTGLANVISNSTGGFHIGISNTFTNNNGALEETGVFSQFTGSSVGNIRGAYNEINNSGNGVHYGLYNNINGSGGFERYGVENILTGSSGGIQYGVENTISASGNNTHYGTQNYLNGTGTGSHLGIRNWLASTGSGEQTGSENLIDNTGVGIHKGTSNKLSGAGNGEQYGTYNYITNTGTGIKYGTANYLLGSSNDEIFGVKNFISAEGTGLRNGFSNTLTGAGTGVFTGVQNTMSRTGNSTQYGMVNNFSGVNGGLQVGVRNRMQTTGTANDHIGIDNYITDVDSWSNSNIGIKNLIDGAGWNNAYGAQTTLSGSSLGVQYGQFIKIDNTGNNSHYGSWTELNGSGSGTKFAQYNVVNSYGSGAGGHYGVQNLIYNNGGLGERVGVNNVISVNNSSTVDSYGTKNVISGSFGTGGKRYGSYNKIQPPFTGAESYGVFADVPSGATNYAGYFLGNFAIGTLPANTYKMPVSRGANFQIIQTDGAGTASWVSPDVALNDFTWNLNGNSAVTAAHFIGSTNNADVLFKRGNVLAGSISSGNTSFGLRALFSNAGGTRNTAFGIQALNAVTTGNYNTAVGYNAYIAGNFSNSTAIGDAATITASSQIRLGDTGVSSIGGQVGWTTVSDGRFKKNIQSNVPGLEFIKKLNPVTYNLDLDALADFLKTPQELRKPESEKLKAGLLQTGFIAQEVELASKEIGFEFSGVDQPKNGNDYYGLRYAEFVVPLVKAVQEQQQIIDAEKEKNATLQQQLNALENRLKAIEEKLNK